MRRAVLCVMGPCALALGAAPVSGADFPAAVLATQPAAYFRLGAAAGQSEVGTTRYTSSGGVTVEEGGIAGGRFVRLDGREGSIVTTQAGGVSSTASIMAWVNLDTLPSAEGHFFYVAGESEYGNDLDVQFETNDVLKFYTASGGNVSFKPPADTLPHQWHMIVATLDTNTKTRTLYWDGTPVATDSGGGRAGKKGIFSVGESTVFRGRHLKGGVQEVALWNRALSASEVTAIYAARGRSAPGQPTAAGEGPAPTSASKGLFATTAVVEAADGRGPLKLQREEQIALMFMTAIQQIEAGCQSSLQRACTLDQLLAGPVASNGAQLGRLKYAPQADPNYTYTVSASGAAWEAHANAKKPGLGGFCFFSRSFPIVQASYNPSGAATAVDPPLSSRSIMGDSFVVR